jgi:MarR family transcriptional repressor of mepA
MFMEDKNIFNSIKELEKGIVRKIMSETSHDEMFSKPSIAQMQIIKYILKHEEETIYQRDLEEVFNLRRATISGILKTMEKNNVIIRVCDPNDARGKIVILSDDAKKFFKEKETLFKKLETILKKDISKEELEIFYKVILKMRDNINRKD